MIFKVYREQLTDFVPKFKLKRSKAKAAPEESKTQESASISYPIV